METAFMRTYRLEGDKDSQAKQIKKTFIYSTVGKFTRLCDEL